MGYTAELDKLRKSPRWQKLRGLVLRSHPMCQQCRKQLTQIVDHIIPAEIAVMQARLSGKYLDKWAGYFIRSNLQGLCRMCHALKTAEDKAHTGRWPDVVERDAQAPKRVWTF
jgi:5-methylcytosine-specific restriction endonuclease McrA